MIFPPISAKYRETDGRREIFDPVRRKYVQLTPEEWIRQHVIHFLHYQLAYPLSLLSIEKRVTYNRLQKRFDILASDYCGRPRLLVECKSKDAGIDSETFAQAAVYNFALQADYLLITDGERCFTARINLLEKTWEFIGEIPGFVQLAGVG
ncbi:MAG: type I restriction enzyme HsdR N-terminal domain-containing protein [Bacteroidetes bacterium]|nr:type I restriction enzyme HsdR N-terminal domain-containing protein [Bacteroidota bacterium]MBU1719808.1 type I restriction enzyme HsdR N-terminal domain-containing protein [Bacteroidota bacterium]